MISLLIYSIGTPMYLEWSYPLCLCTYLPRYNTHCELFVTLCLPTVKAQHAHPNNPTRSRLGYRNYEKWGALLFLILKKRHPVDIGAANSGPTKARSIFAVALRAGQPHRISGAAIFANLIITLLAQKIPAFISEKRLHPDPLETITKFSDPESPDNKFMYPKTLLHGCAYQPHLILRCQARQSRYREN